ncbi:hypothetical protein EVAR_54866_1 [Eumeta japonica]|uniref:Uncharacterized protein n=1 Tax=Eumeta variegata TaxID=151549 RepID=A0A4C1YFQ5_EUMVA|nr:hypothetical protein EVAR_54866_1 [Eumeta japonica]
MPEQRSKSGFCSPRDDALAAGGRRPDTREKLVICVRLGAKLLLFREGQSNDGLAAAEERTGESILGRAESLLATPDARWPYGRDSHEVDYSACF